jgi:predicted translin family RNA/ssDNA-binding protein
MDKVMFEKIRDGFEKEEAEREKIILESRVIIKSSKEVIYSLHRGDINSAKIALEEMEKRVKSLIKSYKGTKHEFSGSYKISIQEYVEAKAYYEYSVDARILPYSEDLDYESYLLGLCDLSGELVRMALNMGIEGNFEKVYSIRKFVSDLFDELAKFDFRNGELRKKSDSIRWDLKKLDDMVFELKVKGKI